MTMRSALSLLPLSFVATVALGAQSPPLTLGSAARVAAERSAGPLVARERTAQADARVRQRQADFLPTLSAVANGGERTFNSASFGISFKDPLTGKSAFDPNGEVLGPVRTYDVRGTVRQTLLDPGAFARLKAARASAASVTTEQRLAAQQAAVTAAVAYVRVMRADAQVGARVQDSTLASELLGIARDQVSAGVGIALDVTRAQSQLASARSQLIAARAERDRARLELAHALGLPAGTPIVLADSLTAVTADALPSEGDASAKALASRAELRLANDQITAAEKQLTALKAERLPSLAAFADQGSTGKGTEHLLPTYSWGVQLSIPIFDGFKREGRLDEQRAALRELDARKHDIAEQAALDVRAALLDVNAAREMLAAADERRALAEQELAQARDRFTAGVSGNADVITASQGLNAARTQVVEARAAVQAARVALARAQGTITDLP
jgi:outer membrane protein TolC